MTGKVYLAGSGPGGLSLLTYRAREVIDKADVILYDQLPGEEILSSLPAKAEKIDVGKYKAVFSMPIVFLLFFLLFLLLLFSLRF